MNLLFYKMLTASDSCMHGTVTKISFIHTSHHGKSDHLSSQVSFVYIAPDHNKVVSSCFTYRVSLDHTL